MLDELLEYKEYTDKRIIDDVLEFNSKETSSNKRKQIRLKYLNFNNDFSGIKRAMNIIAKYFLNKYDQNEEIAINALKAWAGDEYDNKGIKEIDEIAGYIRPELFSFYRANEENTNNNINKIENIEKLKEKYNNKLKGFNEDILNEDSKASKAGISDFNKTTYKSIVYNMKNKPLRRNVLVCKEDVLDKALRNNKPLTPKEKDYLLKLISVYLLNAKKNQEYVTITLTDVYNWCLINHKNTKLSEYKFENGEHPIKSDNSNIKSKTILNNVIKRNYKVIELNNIESIEYGDTLFMDMGNKGILEKYYIDSNFSIKNLIEYFD